MVSYKATVLLKIWGAWILHQSSSGGYSIASPSPLNDDECGLYLATSTIPGAGLGAFAGKNAVEGSIVSAGDICVPVIDLSWHQQREHAKTLEEYLWDGSTRGMRIESGRKDARAFCFGLDSLANSGNSPNVGPSSLEYDDCGYHRSSSVSTGAFTPYFNSTSKATTNLTAGMELLKDYGDRRYDQHEHRVNKDNDETSNHRNTHSLQWLRSNGACLDNIRPALSTLPRAGHGAFATRNISAGAVVTVSPLQIIPNDSLLVMYNILSRIPKDSTQPDHAWYRLVDEPQTPQLLLNYCFGEKSTDPQPLFCPNGAGVNLINHDKLRTNIRVQWATDFPSLHNHSFVVNGTKEDLHSGPKPQIAFQYVALTDILEGDELLMDYGDEWVATWVKHAVDYSNSDETYIAARDYNSLFADVPFRTEEQVKFDPYPVNLQLRCHTALLTQPIDMTAAYIWSHDDDGYPCNVLDYFREFGLELYTVALEVLIDDGDDDGDGLQRVHLTDIPRSAIQFFDVPSSTDIHQAKAFRHPIGFPAGVRAPAWLLES